MKNRLCALGMCFVMWAMTTSGLGNNLTEANVEDQARQLIDCYREGDVNAYYALNSIGGEGLISVFLEALNDSDADIRILAINQLTNYRNVEALEAISNLLKHDDREETRAAAASSLGQLGYQQAIPHLLDALNDESPVVVEAAIRGLGWLKSGEAIEPLKEKLRGDNEKDWVIQRAAADALQDITGEDWSQDIHEFPPDLRVRDADITLEAYQRAMEYLGERLPEMIDTTITTEELASKEGFYTGYWNRLTIIEGYHLKQNLQIREGALNQTLQSQKLNEAGEDEVMKAQKAYDEARQKYEDFLADSVWAD